MTAELGRAIRDWRERTTPAMVGLPAGGRRRAPGLRREELGLLAGVSVDYIIQLEQGRATAPSAQVVQALARAFRLDDVARDVLFRQANLLPPSRGTLSARLTPGVQRLIDRLSGTPVNVLDAAWNWVSANELYRTMLGDLGDARGLERNIVWRHFVGPGMGPVHHEPEQLASCEAAMVGDLRVAAARYPADPELRDLIAVLRADSAPFAALWDSGVTGEHESARKMIEHPVVGELYLDCDVLTVPGSDLRIVAYTAEPESESDMRLALLGAFGTFAGIL